MRRGVRIVNTTTGVEEHFVAVGEGRSLDKVEDGIAVNLGTQFHTEQVNES